MTQPTAVQDNQEDRRADELLMRAIRRIHSTILGLVFGILFGLLIFVATAVLVVKGPWSPGDEVGPHLILLSHFFPGYTVTWGGSFLGGFYGFVTGFLGGWLIGWVYNALITFKSRRR